MGACISNDDEHQQELVDQRKPSMGVGLGVAMMMQQAGAMMGAPHPHIDPAVIHAQIRKAKAEGRTVTMVNGSLYVDYRLVAHIPPNLDIRV